MDPQQKVNITLTIDQVNTILDALGELSFKRSASVIDAVRAQAVKQIQEAAPAASE